MYRWKESAALLNGHVAEAQTTGMALRIHGWGVDVPHYDNPVHKHTFVEICYVMEGEGSYTDQGTDYPLGPGTLFCSRPGATHQIRSRSGLTLLHISFELDESRSTPEGAERYRQLVETSTICVSAAETSAAAALWRALLLTEETRQALPVEQLPAAAGLLIAALVHLFQPDAAQPQLRARSGSAQLLERAKRYIRDNLDTDLTLQEVADYLHVSPRHLSRLFSEGIHESFGRFLRRERVGAAARLLRQSEQPIPDIAERCGFGSVHAFTRAFTRERGQSPARYRRGAAPLQP